MSNELLDALESKLLAAVDTIEALRAEVNEFKGERRLMEDKLRGLIGRIDQAGGDRESAAESVEPAAEPARERPAGSYNGPTNPYRQPDTDF